VKIKKILISGVAITIFFCGGVSANELEANVALSTDYVFIDFLKPMKIQRFLVVRL
jgi:hypothetical protein